MNPRPLRLPEQLSHREVGQGPAVLLLHGVGGAGRIYDAFLAAHPGPARFLVVDFPGCGRALGQKVLEPLELARQLSGFLDEQGVERLSIVGHSFGGVAAIELALLMPSRVEALVIASAPALGLPEVAAQLLAHPVSGLAVRALTRLPHLRAMVRKYLGLLWGEPSRIPEAMVSEYFEAVREKDFYPTVLEMLRALSSYRLPGAMLAAAKVPTAVVWGEADRLVPLAQGQEIARALASPLTVLERTGHCVPEERPEALARILLELREGSLPRSQESA